MNSDELKNQIHIWAGVVLIGFICVALFFNVVFYKLSTIYPHGSLISWIFYVSTIVVPLFIVFICPLLFFNSISSWISRRIKA